jgi:hypothetical protein
LTAMIAVIVDCGSGGIEPNALMAALSMLAEVDGGSNNGVLTTASCNNNCHPHPHCPCPSPPLDEDRIAGWRARHVASYLLLPHLSSLAPFLSPLTGQGAKDNGCSNRQGRHADIRSWEEVGHHGPIGMEQQKQKHKQKPKPKKTHTQKQKQNKLQWRQRHRLCTCRQLRPRSHRCCFCMSRGSSGGSMGVAVAAAGTLRV